MTLGCMVWELPGMDLLEHVRWVARQGFEAVDIHVSATLPGKAVDPDQVDEAYVAELVEALSPVPVRGIHAAFGLTLISGDEVARRASLAYLHRTFGLAEQIGARTVTCHKGAPAAWETRRLRHANFRDSLRSLLPSAEAAEVTLCLEVEDDYDLVADMQADRLKVCVDLGHICFHDGAGYRAFGSIPGLLRHLGPHIGHIHAHDWDGRTDHLPIGDGGHDWPAIMGALRDIDYQGAVVLEINPIHGGAEGILRSRDALAKVIS